MKSGFTHLLAGLLCSGAIVVPAAADTLREDAKALFEPIPAGPVEINGAVPTEAQIELGRMLYFEPRLSEAGNISCNTCHNLGTGGADLASVSLGHRWQKGGRNSPTVLNAVFNTAQFWDGRAADLVEQAGGPMVNPVEMASNPDRVNATLTSIPGYLPFFEAAFPGQAEPVSFENAALAIAAFEATLVTPGSPFDRWLGGEDGALDERQREGLALFIEKGCAACHNGVNVGGGSYQPFGVTEMPGWSVLPPDDRGRYAVTRSESDAYVFKVPTLRNIALTPPYFHSGAVWDLGDAVAVMGSAQLGAELSDREVTAIAAFLVALTGEQPQVVYPILPPSGPDTPRPAQ